MHSSAAGVSAIADTMPSREAGRPAIPRQGRGRVWVRLYGCAVSSLAHRETGACCPDAAVR